MAKAEQQLRDAIERVRCQYMERESIQFCEVYMMQLTQLHILVRSGNENPLDAYDFRGNPVSKTSDAYYLSPEFRNSVKVFSTSTTASCFTSRGPKLICCTLLRRSCAELMLPHGRKNRMNFFKI